MSETPYPTFALPIKEQEPETISESPAPVLKTWHFVAAAVGLFAVAWLIGKVK